MKVNVVQETSWKRALNAAKNVIYLSILLNVESVYDG